MQIRINERCSGHGRCYASAQQLIEPDEYGHGRVIGDGTVPPELADEAQEAALACPESAVEVAN